MTGKHHEATFAFDRRTRGYVIRVVGPSATSFPGRDIPVKRRDGTTTTEKLGRVLWNGTDKTTGETIAIYSFVSRPKDPNAKEEEF